MLATIARISILSPPGLGYIIDNVDSLLTGTPKDVEFRKRLGDLEEICGATSGHYAEFIEAFLEHSIRLPEEQYHDVREFALDLCELRYVQMSEPYVNNSDEKTIFAKNYVRYNEGITKAFPNFGSKIWERARKLAKQKSRSRVNEYLASCVNVGQELGETHIEKFESTFRSLTSKLVRFYFVKTFPTWIKKMESQGATKEEIDFALDMVKVAKKGGAENCGQVYFMIPFGYLELKGDFKKNLYEAMNDSYRFGTKHGVYD